MPLFSKKPLAMATLNVGLVLVSAIRIFTLSVFLPVASFAPDPAAFELHPDNRSVVARNNINMPVTMDGFLTIYTPFDLVMILDA